MAAFPMRCSCNWPYSGFYDRNWRFHRAMKNKLFYKTWDIFCYADLCYEDLWFTDFNRHMRQSISPRLAQGGYDPDTLKRNKIILFLLSTFEYLWGVYYSIFLNSRVLNKNKRTPVSWKNIWRGDLDGIDFLIVRVFLWPGYYRFWSISTTKLKFF